MNSSYFRPKDIAQKWDVSLETVHRLLRSGKLKSFRVGPGRNAPYLINEEELNRYEGRKIKET